MTVGRAKGDAACNFSFTAPLFDSSSGNDAVGAPFAVSQSGCRAYVACTIDADVDGGPVLDPVPFVILTVYNDVLPAMVRQHAVLFS